jgi:hypothetical protein
MTSHSLRPPSPRSSETEFKPARASPEQITVGIAVEDAAAARQAQDRAAQLGRGRVVEIQELAEIANAEGNEQARVGVFLLLPWSSSAA